MRKLIYAAFAAMMLAGCTQKPADEIESPKELKTYDFSFKGETGDLESEADTKAYGSSVVRLNWQKGDRVSVINLTKGSKMGGTLKTEDSGIVIATFKGKLMGDLDEGDQLAFIYPVATDTTYDANFKANGSRLVVDFTEGVGPAARNASLCAYAILTYTVDPENQPYAKFSFLMNFTVLGITGMEPNEKLESIKIHEVGQKINIGVNGSGTGISGSSTEGTITITPNCNANDEGNISTFFCMFGSGAKDHSRIIEVFTPTRVYQGAWQAKEYTYNKYITTSVHMTVKYNISRYERATSVTSGGQYLIVCEGKESIFNGATSSNSTKIEGLSDGTLTTYEDLSSNLFTITETGTVEDGVMTYYIQKDGYYYGLTSTSTSGLNRNKTTQYTNKISIDQTTGVATISSGKDGVLNVPSSAFNYKEGATSNIQLYKLAE